MGVEAVSEVVQTCVVGDEKEMVVSIDAPIRFSHLRAYGRSAAHGYHARLQDPAVTGAMQRGTAVHALMFGTRKVMGWDGVQRRGKAYDEFVAANPDVEILTASEYDKANAMVRALRACKAAEPVLQGIAEQTIYFDWYGRKCRATPDIRGDGFVTELKTAKSSDPAQFQWASLRMAYHAQLKMQNVATNTDVSYLVCVESAEPYPVTVFRVTDEALLEGEKLLTLWMERLINCEKADYYPPYVECIVPLDVPTPDVDLDYGDSDD